MGFIWVSFAVLIRYVKKWQLKGAHRFLDRSADKSAWVEGNRRVSSTLSVSNRSVFGASTSVRS